MPEVVTVGETLVLFSPEQNGPLRHVEGFKKRIAGAESNTAIALSRLEHSCGWISKIGRDEFGQFILREIRAEGVDVSGVRIDENAPTGIMFKEIFHGMESRVYYYRKGSAASMLRPEDIDPEYIKNAKILHITGITPALNISCLETIWSLIRTAKENGVLISFDPNIRLKLWSREQASSVLNEILPYADIVLSGVGEGEIILGESNAERLIDILLELGVGKVALKMGAEGCWVADMKSRYRINAVEVGKKVDPIGAGDAFNAGFLAGVLEGKGIEECGRMGNIMGAFAITTRGDIEGLPGRRELGQFMNHDKGITR
ncbi:sugar kinase [Ruminiclostridium cellobioparum]|uniref:sugar kinase n=1 Tax=Ruminiclostridium cellobioparum TaxID=29355 RepID=UPI0028A84906|nr:sugar kinase [Ruminiclostridium cellobioparum]